MAYTLADLLKDAQEESATHIDLALIEEIQAPVAKPTPSVPAVAPRKDGPPAKKRAPAELDPAPITKKAEGRYIEFAHQYIKLGFNGTRAYQAVYGASYEYRNKKPMPDSSAAQQATKLLKNIKVQEELVRITAQLRVQHEIDEDFVVGHWAAMAKANIMDYFEIAEGGEFAGHLVLKGKDLNGMPTALQQNIKKFKLRHRFRPGRDEDDPGQHEQDLELELIDRKAVLDSIAKYRGMFVESVDAVRIDIAVLIQEGADRAEKGRLYDGETGEEIDDE